MVTGVTRAPIHRMAWAGIVMAVLAGAPQIEPWQKLRECGVSFSHVMHPGRIIRI